MFFSDRGIHLRCPGDGLTDCLEKLRQTGQKKGKEGQGKIRTGIDGKEDMQDETGTLKENKGINKER